jgi:hypothetical protein
VGVRRDRRRRQVGEVELFVPVSGAPDALRRPMTASWSPRLSRSHASMSILMRRATT